ncbi:MAG: hypothetical protein BWY51_00297 [Parcubacteria group bacterium ADurb.Bin316]|nr:MAG: hypothetical protein BWY51_00297 [Parcubacteria group bacterium ADurb.Bin316]HOZ56049.1 SAM-dependent chlorinase/fluorinase [bacterium]
MFITVINDCADHNARGRQLTRLSSLFNCPINFIGVNSDLEAAGNLIDVLDAAGNAQGVILVNVAPRHGEAKKWHNGTPFGYFKFKNILIVSSIDGLTLSLIKKLKLAKNINVLDLKKCAVIALKKRLISKNEADTILATQFRSFDFLPRVAFWLAKKIKMPAEKFSISEIADAPNTIWWIDNFGNCKTTLLANEIEKIKRLNKKFARLPFYRRLKDVPDKKTAVVIGSSGIGKSRFLEIIKQGGNAKKYFKIHKNHSAI